MSARPNSRGASGARGNRQGAHVIEMQRRRLTHAVVEVVGEHGLEAATVGRVCEQAGVSRRTFYELFGDREECFWPGSTPRSSGWASTCAPHLRVPGAGGSGSGPRSKACSRSWTRSRRSGDSA